MIEIDGEYWYSQLEAADFLSMTWRTVIHVKRNVKEIRTMKIANQNYYEFKSLAGYNQEHQRPSKRRDLILWKHPELKLRKDIDSLNERLDSSADNQPRN